MKKFKVMARSALVLFTAGGLLLSGLPASSAAVVSDPGPALQTPAAQLAAALSCSADLASPAKTPVLLVPGTVESADEIYSWGYQRTLAAQGRPVCTLTLPKRATVDFQISAEFVVAAIRYMNLSSGVKISAMGHSQGGMLLTWAVKFWPDLAPRLDDVINIAAPVNGSDIANRVICPGTSCPAVGWQVKTGSQWTKALAARPLPAGLSYTTIGSNNDELVWPSPAATNVVGASNIIVQSICPWRFVGHVSALADNAVNAVVMDALNDPGPAVQKRISTSVCWGSSFAGIDYLGMAKLAITAAAIVDRIVATPWVAAEPPLRDYAR